MNNSNTSIYWISPFTLNDGHSIASRRYLHALNEHGYNLYIHSIYGVDERVLHDDPCVSTLWPFIGRKSYKNSYDLCVFHWDYDSIGRHIALLPNVKKRVGLTVWETTKISPRAAFILDRFDELWVPSEFVKKVLQDSNVRVPIYVIPHIVPQHSEFDRAFYHRYYDPGKFTFYFIGTWIKRKNVDGLVRAFVEEFHGVNDVRLLLKVNPVSGMFIDVVSLIERIKNSINNPPDILCINERLSWIQMASIHEVGNCFVSAGRGEGFALNTADAKVVGNTIIATGFGADTELTNGNDKLVPYRLLEVVPDQMTLDYPGHQWADPDISELKKAMREVYELKPAKCKSNLSRFSEENVGQLMVNRIESLLTTASVTFNE